VQTYFFAYLAGTLTTLNPCVLPMIPFVLATALREGRFGPLALAAGLTLTFTAAGVLVTALGPALGISLEGIRAASAVIIILLGLAMLVPVGNRAFATAMGPVANGANTLLDKLALTGLSGQFVTGMLLGLIWTPCSGPTLIGAIGLASQGGSLWHAGLTMLVFSLGASTVLVALAYGTREVLARRKQSMMAVAGNAKLLFGALFISIGVMILTGYDKVLEAALLDIMPEWLINLTTQF
jgi:cytochrome c biogenesis protein CcdA